MAPASLRFTVVLLVLCAAPAAAQSTVHSPEAFVAELERLRTEVESAPHGQIPDLRTPAVWVVDAGGQRFELPAGWLRAQVETARRDPAQWPAQRTGILAQLEALTAEVQELAAAARPAARLDPASARVALAEVLAGREFRQLHEQSALARVWERISQFLQRAWDRLGAGRLGRPGAATVLAWLTVLVALSGLGVWLARLLLRPERAARVAGDTAVSNVRSARAWAQDALQAGDPKETMRLGYRAAVRGLEEEGTWRADPARTPREYLRLLPAGHRRRARLSDIAGRFEEIFFGARPATEDDRRAVLSGLKELGCLPAD